MQNDVFDMRKRQQGKITKKRKYFQFSILCCLPYNFAEYSESCGESRAASKQILIVVLLNDVMQYANSFHSLWLFHAF